MLAAFFLRNKANPALPTLPQAKAATFIPANLLQSWRIQPMPASTSSLIPFHSPDKQNVLDEQVTRSPLWPSTLEVKNLQEWGYAVKINFNYLPNID